MDKQSQRLVNQLLAKTQEGKLVWTTAFEDGQFKTVLPTGGLAFVVQVKGDVRRFEVLDQEQGTVLNETITRSETEHEPAHHPKLVLYSTIGKLQEVVSQHALQANAKLDKAERILATI